MLFVYDKCGNYLIYLYTEINGQDLLSNTSVVFTKDIINTITRLVVCSRISEYRYEVKREIGLGKWEIGLLVGRYCDPSHTSQNTDPSFIHLNKI